MTLFDYYLKYMSELCEGQRAVPEGIAVTETDPTRRALEIQKQCGDMAAFVRLCAAQDGTEIPQEVYDSFDPASLFAAPQAAQEASGEPEAEGDAAPAPDPDKDKHAFEVFLDCLALDDRLIQYLIDVLKRRDWKEFYKLSHITTKLDLDPEEFLYWLGHREDYAADDERACAVIMDTVLQNLLNEGQTETAAALISGDETTFNALRCERQELVHLPEATYAWFSRHYLDRDYPLRAVMKWNGVEFPEKKG